MESHVLELDIKLRGFFECIFDAAYFCDLAADVEVYQFETIGHLGFFQEIESF